MNTANLGQPIGLSTIPGESILTWSAKVFIYFEIQFNLLRSPLEFWRKRVMGLTDQNQIKYETENKKSNFYCC